MSFLPPSTNDQYRGSDLSSAFLGLLAVLTIAPALVHSFAPDGGAVGIAHLDLGDRRDLVVAVFRWEGATQLALGLAMLAVALRYRPLTALFLMLVILERGLMALQGWVLAPPASGRHPPEHYGSLVMVALSVVFLVLALRPSARRRA
jgi:hypothetical protein